MATAYQLCAIQALHGSTRGRQTFLHACFMNTNCLSLAAQQWFLQCYGDNVSKRQAYNVMCIVLVWRLSVVLLGKRSKYDSHHSGKHSHGFHFLGWRQSMRNYLIVWMLCNNAKMTFLFPECKLYNKIVHAGHKVSLTILKVRKFCILCTFRWRCQKHAMHITNLRTALAFQPPSDGVATGSEPRHALDPWQVYEATC